MSEVKCPYCGHEQEINHDDGYGYEEGPTHEQDCVSCERVFEYTTTISFSYDVYCFEEEDHDLVQSRYEPSLYECKNCNYCEVKNDN